MERGLWGDGKEGGWKGGARANGVGGLWPLCVGERYASERERKRARPKKRRLDLQASSFFT